MNIHQWNTAMLNSPHRTWYSFVYYLYIYKYIYIYVCIYIDQDIELLHHQFVILWRAYIAVRLKLCWRCDKYSGVPVRKDICKSRTWTICTCFTVILLYRNPKIRILLFRVLPVVLASPMCKHKHMLRFYVFFTWFCSCFGITEQVVFQSKEWWRQCTAGS